MQKQDPTQTDPRQPDYHPEARDAIINCIPFYDPHHKCNIVREFTFNNVVTELKARADHEREKAQEKIDLLESQLNAMRPTRAAAIPVSRTMGGKPIGVLHINPEAACEIGKMAAALHSSPQASLTVDSESGMIHALALTWPPDAPAATLCSSHDFFSLFEATAYNLWMAALQGGTPATKELYLRMRNPQVGDMVMEITSYRQIKKNRRGTGTLIAIEDNENRYLKKWTIQTPDGDTCDWTNADVIAIPTDVHDWFPPLNANNPATGS